MKTLIYAILTVIFIILSYPIEGGHLNASEINAIVLKN